jgi:UDP-glucose 4-epimerase
VTRYLVTGGAGLVGSHLVDLLLEDEDATVVVLDDFSRGRRTNLDAAAVSERLEIVEADIRDRAALARVVDGVDTVFHQAALRITQCADDPRLAVEVLVNGTYELLDAAVRAGVRKVVAASSASLYGTAEQFPTSERHHPYNDDTIYGAAKAFAEGLLRSFHAMHGLESVSLRYFNVYGPRMDVSGVYTEVLIRWIERIAAGRPPVVFGDGTETMDFVFVEDVARANVLAATRSSGGAEAFNIASGQETSLNELAGLLLRVMGSDVGVEFGPPRPVNGVRRRLADVRRARDELGFEAQIGLDEGLRRLVAWWSAQHGYARSA